MAARTKTGPALAEEERDMLEGRMGDGPRKALELVVAVGTVYGAARLVPVESVHVSGISYSNIGRHGLAYMKEILAGSRGFRVPTTVNPCGMDLETADGSGLDGDFVAGQRAIVDALSAAGADAILTCTPYRAGVEVKPGAALAWAESSAASWANSMLGARTNRPGGPEALCSAVTGRTAEYGLLLEENRVPTHVVDAVVRLCGPSDFGLLGLQIGSAVGAGVPFIRLAPDQPEPSEGELLAMAAAMGAAGSVALFYVEDATPAPPPGRWETEARKTRIDALEAGSRMLSLGRGSPDLVAFGCPHASIGDLRDLARIFRRRKARIRTWAMTSRKVRDAAREEGIAAELAASGVEIVCDTCVVSAPLGSMGFRRVALDSAKAAFYCPSHCGVEVVYAPREKCADLAVRG